MGQQKTINEKPEKEQIALKHKVAYGLGAVAENTMQNGISSMASPFFNVALGVSPALLGIATSVFRLWDAVTDPIMGWISDRTQHRLGRRRPYIMLGSVLSSLLFVMMWWCPRGMSTPFYFTWFLLVSLFFYTAFTVFGVPYLALGYEISSDYDDRTRVMAFRTWFASVSGISIQWTFWLTQRSVFEDTVDGMRWVGMGIGLLVLLAGLAPGLFLKEKPLSVSEQAANRKVHLRSALSVLKVRPFQIVLGALTCAMIGLFLVGILGFYVNVYYVFGGNLRAASTIIGASGSFYHICCMLSIPIVAWISGKVGKKASLLFFMFIAVLANLAKWWCYTPDNPWLQLIAVGLMAPGLSAMWTLLASMTADTTDCDELENGTRREGSFGAVYSWTMKLGLALCLLIAGYILEWTGFDAGLGEIQPERTLRYMRLLFTFVPAGGLLFAMLIIAHFPIDKQRAAEIRDQLGIRKRSDSLQEV